jgi:hypothetical protein
MPVAPHDAARGEVNDVEPPVRLHARDQEEALVRAEGEGGETVVHLFVSQQHAGADDVPHDDVSVKA